MNNMRPEIVEKYNKLSPENQDKAIRFLTLLVDCPGFLADLRAAAPAWGVCPPPEITDALMEKWGRFEI